MYLRRLSYLFWLSIYQIHTSLNYISQVFILRNAARQMFLVADPYALLLLPGLMGFFVDAMVG